LFAALPQVSAAHGEQAYGGSSGGEILFPDLVYRGEHSNAGLESIEVFRQ